MSSYHHITIQSTSTRKFAYHPQTSYLTIWVDMTMDMVPFVMDMDMDMVSYGYGYGIICDGDKYISVSGVNSNEDKS